MSDKRNIIMNTALKLFNHSGIATSTADIAKFASVANGTLFHYFPTKDELINTMFAEYKIEYFHAVTANIDLELSMKSKLRRLWLNALDWTLNNPDKHKFVHYYYNSPHVSDANQKLVNDQHQFIKKIFSTAIEKSIIKNIPIDYLLLLCLSNISASADYILSNIDLKDDYDFKEYCFEILFNSIKY